MRIRAARTDEYQPILELMARAFPPGDPAVGLVAATIHNDPRFHPELLRVAERDGRIVGVVHLIDRPVRIGSVQLPCAMIAPLATAPEHQGSGVGSALMRDALDWMRTHGKLLSMLWGHPWLYPRYGYAPGIKRYCVSVPATLQPYGETAYTLRPATPGDACALAEVYHTATATTTLAETRSDQPWEWRAPDPATTTEVVIDPVGALRGYLRSTPRADHLYVGEVMALDLGAARALFDRLLQLLRQHGLAEARVNSPPDLLWSRVAWAQGAQVCTSNGQGAGMVRVIDTPALLRALQPELERRVRRSEWVARRSAVRIETPAGRATVRLDHGVIAIDDGRAGNAITLPFHALGPLISGYQSIVELQAATGVYIDGADTLRLLEVLFPEGYPHWTFAAYYGEG